MPSTLDNWKRIQDKGYFETNVTYQGITKFPEIPEIIPLIKNKVIAEIGCGYGRETFFMAKHAKKIYAIDVSLKVKEMLRSNVIGSAEIIFVLAEEFEKSIPDNSLDYVRSRFVFQHLAPDDSQRYINGMYSKLTKNGILDIQTYVDNENPCMNINDTEPTVHLKASDFMAMFTKYEILEENYVKGDYRGTPYTWLFVKAKRM